MCSKPFFLKLLFLPTYTRERRLIEKSDREQKACFLTICPNKPEKKIYWTNWTQGGQVNNTDHLLLFESLCEYVFMLFAVLLLSPAFWRG